MNTVKGDTNRVELDCGNDCTNSQLYHVILSKYMLHELYFNKAHKKKQWNFAQAVDVVYLANVYIFSTKNSTALPRFILISKVCFQLY